MGGYVLMALVVHAVVHNGLLPFPWVVANPNSVVPLCYLYIPIYWLCKEGKATDAHPPGCHTTIPRTETFTGQIFGADGGLSTLLPRRSRRATPSKEIPDMNPDVSSCTIVGAGLSGLAAAGRLQDAGVRVTVFEREETVGGRMRTDRLGSAVFDSGAQFFTVRGDSFREMVESWVSAGVAEVWTRGFADAEGNHNEDGYPRYRGVGGMAAIAGHLARDLDVRTGAEVEEIRPAGRAWRVVASGSEHEADALVLAMPAPAALALVDRSGVNLPSDARRDLERIAYEPCIAVMAALDGEGAAPRPGGVQIGGEPLFWVADNRRKGISEAPAITIHAGPEFSREHANTDDARVTQLLLEAAKGYLGGAGVRETAVRRWAYSMPSEPFGERFVHIDVPLPLLFCGDAYAGPKVEGAITSGLAAAERLLGGC